MVLPLGFRTTENNTSLSQFLSRITKIFLLDLEHATPKYDNLLYQIFFLSVCVPACICKCVHAVCVKVVEAKRGIKSPGSRVPGACEPSGMGAENGTWVL